MQEPNWDEIEQRMLVLTLNQLKPVKSMFCGCLEGASAKREVVREMRNQMQYWWKHVDGDAGKVRVRHVLEVLEETEGERIG